MFELYRLMRLSQATLLLVVILSFGACSRESSAKVDTPEQTQGVGSGVQVDNGPSITMISGLDAREALALANKWGPGEKSVTTFVDTQKISFEFGDGEKITVPLPDAKMVVAIAPYINTTHPCETHYVSGCQGELVNVPIKVFGKTADGLVVVDTTVTTLENGFFELWLARDLEIELTVEFDGKSASGTITTDKKSNTCITTMRLI